MKGIRVQRHLAINSVFIYLALFCVSSFALLERVTVSIGAFSPIKLQLMYAGFLCILTQIKTLIRCLLKKKYFFVLLSVALFCVLLCISMVANRNSALGIPLYNTVRLLLYLVELFVLMVILAETGRVQGALSFLFWYTLLIVVVNDVLMFTKLITFGTERHESYLVGTKFDVSYLHMALLTLWVMCYAKNRKRMRIKRWLVILGTLFIVMVAIRTNCMTGLLGCTILGVMFTLLESPKGKLLVRLASPGLLVVVIVASVIFIFIVEAIVSIPMIEYFIENVLNRDSSITGRTNIYGDFAVQMSGHWMQGYGFGHGDEMAMVLFGYLNVQNGLLQWVMEVGLLGTSGLLILLVQIFRQLKRRDIGRKLQAMPIVLLVYLYIVLATVEITFNMAFILWFAIIFVMITERKTSALAG